MELINEFRVGVSVAQAWKVLTDLERVAPLMPGAQLQEVEGDEYRGVVKVKVGPISSQYKGVVTFVERDEAAGKVVLLASGRDTKGQGNASATITATMTPDGNQTAVKVVTDLTITGKVAQFGRGVLADVSSALIGQFVEALEADLRRDGDDPAPSSGPNEAPSTSPAADALVAPGTTPVADTGAAASPSSAGVRKIDSPEAQPINLLNAAGASKFKRFLAPALAVGLVIVRVAARRRRR